MDFFLRVPEINYYKIKDEWIQSKSEEKIQEWELLRAKFGYFYSSGESLDSRIFSEPRERPNSDSDKYETENSDQEDILE